MRAAIPDDQFFDGTPDQGGELALTGYADRKFRFRAPNPYPLDAAGRVDDLYVDGLYTLGSQANCGYKQHAWGRYDDDQGFYFGEGIDAVEALTSPSRIRVYFSDSATSTDTQVLVASTTQSINALFAHALAIDDRTIDIYGYDITAGSAVVWNSIRFERYWW